MGELLHVKPHCVLLWPDGTPRGEDGYCVDSADPHIAGQEDKLSTAQDGAVAAPESTWPERYRPGSKGAKPESKSAPAAGSGSTSVPASPMIPPKPAKPEKPEESASEGAKG